MSGLGLLDDVLHRVASLGVSRHEVVNALTVGRVDGVDLDEVVFLDNGIGVLKEAREVRRRRRERSSSAIKLRVERPVFKSKEEEGWKAHLEESSRVGKEVLPLTVSHDTEVELPDLVVL
jgi:hypothetical protein